ncbi:hypothetical protein Ddye_021410 [Dipteronia dyeriana]|uniref:Uncharacterized protein n=1 Tax=Dipteronia dyeriana TaxID=168575 RepID=A0AAD9WXY4_9ROSI|nr:hypothetical protein Ddye_021410 [Dipteronia dyeriana]
MVKRGKREQNNGRAHKTTTTTTISKPKIGNMRWINYFKLEYKRKILMERQRICRWLVDNFDTTTCSIHIHNRRFAINSNLFGPVSGISDQGDQICKSGDVPNKFFWESKIPITSHCIYLKDIEHWLEEMTTADDEFNVALCLFLLGTILSPSATDYVQAGYLILLTDVGSISRKNWPS